jgi:hypothetical protein
MRIIFLVHHGRSEDILPGHSLLEQLQSDIALHEFLFFLEKSEQRRIHERGFSCSGRSGDDSECPQSDLHIYILQIVFCGFPDADIFIHRPVREIDMHFFLSQDILRCQAIRFQEFAIRPIEYQLAAEVSGSRSNLYDPVGCFDEFFIMLYDDDGVSHLFQFLDRHNRPFDLPFIQSDGRFIQDIHDPRQFISELFR